MDAIEMAMLCELIWRQLPHENKTATWDVIAMLLARYAKENPGSGASFIQWIEYHQALRLPR